MLRSLLAFTSGLRQAWKSESQARCMTSLSKAGIPGPDPLMAKTLSSYYGGHIVRRMKLAPSIIELNSVMNKFKEELTPTHFAVAGLRLDALSRSESTGWATHAYHYQRLAADLESRAKQDAGRLILSHIGFILRGLNAIQHRAHPDTLNLLASRVVADDCQRVHSASHKDVKEAMTGFAGQNYLNPTFWSKLFNVLTPSIAQYDAGRLISILATLPYRELADSPSCSVSLREFMKASVTTVATCVNNLPPKLRLDMLIAVSKMPSDTLNTLASEMTLIQDSCMDVLKQRPCPFLPKQVSMLVTACSRLNSETLPAAACVLVVAWMKEGTATQLSSLKLGHAVGIFNAMRQANAGDKEANEIIAKTALTLLQQLEDKGMSVKPSLALSLRQAFSSGPLCLVNGASEVRQHLLKISSANYTSVSG
ncbi:hypothetical protein CEUSTIGMA_g3063.t1 [Chlamydomonas eustigma]|uniref:FAST kinase leucine-rich domain-containing protein n=1 Tax=Chlamydomonas eustigma TaxID=1157962 RepID=A0A250WY52_9CHLO|nr:hypothetical protein CEUSTIGMA_g3063.t1 [Chlamydomonas eustigma]|eukprot:GAX75619.1 hypothetical protein CEUSTIGMA_g3063.t1 [Chlamydomonas eustigma]